MRKELLILLSLLPLTPSCEKEDIKPIRPDIPKTEVVEIKEGRIKREAEKKEIVLDEMIDVKGWKSRGNKFSERVFSAKTIKKGQSFEDPNTASNVKPDGQAGLFGED